MKPIRMQINPAQIRQNKIVKRNNAGVILAVVAILLSVFVLLRQNSPAQYIEQAYSPTYYINTTPLIDNYQPYEAPTRTDRAKLSKILQFVESYPGSQLKGEYMEILIAECNGDYELLAQIVAIATAETGQGKASPLNNNFWGWHANGNRWHDPDRQTMAHEITQGIGTYYATMNDQFANIYTGGDKTSNWLAIYNWALLQMN